MKEKLTSNESYDKSYHENNQPTHKNINIIIKKGKTYRNHSLENKHCLKKKKIVCI